MRTIKFRAWDKADKCMYEVDEIKFHPSVSNPHILFIDNEQLFEPELMQFTGLLDKNGVEIYEGDVVKLAGYKGNVFYWSGKKTTSSPGFYIAESGDEDDILTLGRDWEVIGNLYENPTLLESNL